MSGSPRALAVVDCGLGNIHSLLGCLSRLAPGDRIDFTADPQTIAAADCVLLPGDSSFSACVEEIDARNLRSVLVAAAGTRPFFGICVGMQVLFEASEEGAGAGLGVLPGKVVRFPGAPGAKIPLMGWLDVEPCGAGVPAAQVAAGERFYFLHSYCVKAPSDSAVLSARHTCRFVAAVARGELFATQFHPEKSGAAGVALLEGFLRRVRPQGEQSRRS